MNRTTNYKIRCLTKFINENYTTLREIYGDSIEGMHIAKKIRKERQLRYYSIVFHVQKKGTGIEKPIPKHISIQIGKKVCHVATDVVERGPLQLLSLAVGTELIHMQKKTRGTIGLILHRNGNHYLLSNMHVMAKDFIEKGKTRFEISVDNETTPDILAGEVKACREQGVFSGIDAAIARLKIPGSFENRLPHIGKVGDRLLLSQNTAAQTQLRMVGVTSGLQSGRVTKLGVPKTFRVNNNASVDFTNLIETNLRAGEGDSGAPVVGPSPDNRVIGIVMGSEGGFVYVIPIHLILSEFVVDIL